MLNSRLADEGERLVVHRFATGSIGMAPVAERPEAPAVTGFWRKLFRLQDKFAEPTCAVCVPPGAKLLLHGIPARLRRNAGLEETEEVTFTQLTARENTYRDAVRFRSGLTVLLQRLEPGQTADILSLSVEEEKQPEVVLDKITA
jgi:hypothetical protein